MAKYDVTIRGEVFADDPVKALETIISHATRSKNNEDVWENMRNGESFNITIDFSLYRDDE